MRQFEQATAILVVDDNDDILEMVKAFLEGAGYSVMLAGDGGAGLACFELNRSAIALILTDVEMPVMSGMDMADRVLELDPSLPVLFMSGCSGNANRGYGCVAKPFGSLDLIARIGAAIGHRPTHWAMSEVGVGGTQS